MKEMAKELLKIAASISSMRSGRWSGVVFRAVNSKDKSSALGDGVYFSDTRQDAERYGDEVEEFKVRGLNLLGSNSREYDGIKARADYRWSEGASFRSMADGIAKTAEEEGYDGIYAGGVFGMVVFPGSVSRVRAASKKLLATPKLHMQTVMEKGKTTRKKQEREKVRYVATVGPMLQKAAGPGSKARSIAEAVIKEFPGRNTGAVLTKRKNRWVKLAKQVPAIIEFSEYVGGPKRMYGAALYLVRDVVLGQAKLSDAKKDAQRMATKWFVEKSIGSSGEVFEEGGYEADFRQFLPPNISFKIGPTREVKSIVETFGREKKNWETMARKLAFIAERFNDIVRDVKRDMKSGDDVTRLCALMTAITIETGLRPGEVGNFANVKDPDTGEPIEVETFGVTTMQPRHVKFIRDNFAELRFIGKKGTEQVAELSDKDILGVLQAAVKNTSLGGDTSMLFVTKRGEHADYNSMRKYVAEKWGDITPTDFRKLKATRTFYDKLKNRAAEMRKILAQSVVKSKSKLKDAVVAQIVETLEDAASDAQKALSHDSWKTTIKSYVDPRVVVNFLAQGGLDDTLEDILVNNKNVRLVFNFDAFVDRAKVAKPVVVFDVVGERADSAANVILDIEDLLENLA